MTEKSPKISPPRHPQKSMRSVKPPKFVQNPRKIREKYTYLEKLGKTCVPRKMLDPIQNRVSVRSAHLHLICAEKKAVKMHF